MAMMDWLFYAATEEFSYSCQTQPDLENRRHCSTSVLFVFVSFKSQTNLCLYSFGNFSRFILESKCLTSTRTVHLHFQSSLASTETQLIARLETRFPWRLLVALATCSARVHLLCLSLSRANPPTWPTHQRHIQALNTPVMFLTHDTTRIQHHRMHLDLGNYLSISCTFSMHIAMITLSMRMAIVAIVGNSKHGNVLICPEACCMNTDFDCGPVGFQW